MSFESINPADESLLARYEAPAPAELDRILDAALAAQRAWAAAPFAERAACLARSRSGARSCPGSRSCDSGSRCRVGC